MGGNNAYENTSRSATRGNGQVERSEPLYAGLQAHKFAMANHAAKKEHHRQEDRGSLHVADDQCRTSQKQADRKKRVENRLPIPARIIKTQIGRASCRERV